MAVSSASQSLLIPNAAQNRYSLPVPIPERSASIAYESSVALPVSSPGPPQLDLLADIASDDLQRTSTFRDGLEKAVNDINTKYGEPSRTFIESASPASSVAIRARGSLKPRCLMPNYVDSPTARPVVGELWTALKSQEKTISTGIEKLQAISDELKESMSPFHDSKKPDSNSHESESTELPDSDSDLEESNLEEGNTNQPTECEEKIDEKKQQEADQKSDSTDDIESSSPSNSGSTCDAASAADTDSGYISRVQPKTEKSHGKEVAGSDGIETSSPEGSATGPPEDTLAQKQGCSARKRPQFLKADNTEISAPSKASQTRKSSSPSVSALVNKFRRMEQTPDDQAEGAEQDEASVESNSRFIQSYRQRSEDSDNEDSMLSTVTADSTGEVKNPLVVC